jgi:hypothetical protein
MSSPPGDVCGCWFAPKDQHGTVECLASSHDAGAWQYGVNILQVRVGLEGYVLVNPAVKPSHQCFSFRCYLTPSNECRVLQLSYWSPFVFLSKTMMEVKLPGAMARRIDSMPAMPHTKRTRRGVISTTLICLALFFYWHTHVAIQSSRHLQATDQSDHIQEEPEPAHPPCWDQPGSNDTVVILRTGSTELEDRFRIHLSTSLLCFKHRIVFSDYEEPYHGSQILDALSTVNETIKSHHPDFELYRRIQSQGRAALTPSELSGSPEAFERLEGNVENPGWKLDKWKFMPMLNRTMYEYPDKKWYVFMEADSFLLLSMLQQYLSLLDPTEPYYIGSGSCMGEDLFAHGGSGFVASRPAMISATQYYAENKAEIETLTDQQWAGDAVLGKVFNEAGVKTTDAWPHFQGDYPGLVAYAGADGRYGPAQALREWCVPTISYHHMSSEMIESLWEFEQQWISAHANVSLVLRLMQHRGRRD